MTKLRCASLLSVVAVCVIGTLASCAASPGPAPIEESNNEATQPTTTTTTPRKQPQAKGGFRQVKLLMLVRIAKHNAAIPQHATAGAIRSMIAHTTVLN